MELDQKWDLERLQELDRSPLFQLLSQANQVHALHHPLDEVQVCNLISIKTGGCQEDCKYCAQSSRYQTSIGAQPMMKCEDVLKEARRAVSQGATRICLGAAWREVRDGKAFETILSMIKGIADLGVEVCCTLGMLKDHHAQQLKEAGLYAYNHNLDTSERFYPTIITTRTYQDRLQTIETVQQAGISVCCGGIIGMGEEPLDRLEMLLTLSRLTPQPESVPINRLTPIPGTPLQDCPPLSIWEMVRLVAMTRIVLPRTMIRLSSGRLDMSYEDQALCFLAGANSIFMGEKLLTVGNPSADKDEAMLQLFGLRKRRAFKNGQTACCKK